MIKCLPLYPCCNSKVSWIFLNLVSKPCIRRSQWKNMVITSDVLEKLSVLSSDKLTMDELESSIINQMPSNNDLLSVRDLQTGSGEVIPQ